MNHLNRSLATIYKERVFDLLLQQAKPSIPEYTLGKPHKEAVPLWPNVSSIKSVSAAKHRATDTAEYQTTPGTPEFCIKT